MTKVNVHKAKTHLSRYLDRVEGGETVILCRHNKPIAEIRPIPPEPKANPASRESTRGNSQSLPDSSTLFPKTSGASSMGKVSEVSSGCLHVFVIRVGFAGTFALRER